MIVLIASECQGDARQRSARIIDEFLPRIGRRTWCGAISAEGLGRLRASLAEGASRNSAVACHRVRGRRTVEIAWIVGSRDQFNTRGQVSVGRTGSTIIRPEREPTTRERLLISVCELAAIVHDIGKATALFLDKLTGNKKIADPIRHEYLSCMILAEIGKLCEGGDEAWLSKMVVPDVASGLFQAAFESLASQVTSLRKDMSAKPGDQRPDKSKSENLRLPSKDKPLLRLVAEIAVTHHRLPHGKHLRGTVLAKEGEHINPTMVSEKGLDHLFKIPKDVRPLWKEAKWVASVAELCSRIDSLIKPLEIDDDFQRAAFIQGRLGLMLGDHVASALGSHRSDGEGGRFYANTNRDDGTLAEPLCDHLLSVRKQARSAVMALMYRKNSLPDIPRAEVPECISMPVAKKDSRFRWQVVAARMVRSHRKANKAQPMGFFALLMARTGAGKTRAAPIIMNAASERLRYTLALGLRTLTLQAGDEYQRDLGIPGSHLFVSIGSEMAMKLHRLREKDGKDFGTDAEGIVMAEEIVAMDMGAEDRELPHTFDRIVGEEGKARRMLSAPLLVTTIDSLMSYADARRGRHLVAACRVATSDLIIDEIDDYGIEDQVAICRLVFLAGCYGRKVVVSSATISPPLAEALFGAYMDGYRLHALLSGQNPAVACGWFSDVSDASTVETVTSSEQFTKLHATVAEKMAVELNESPGIRRMTVLPVGEPNRPEEYFEAVSAHVVRFHQANSVVDPETGKRLSIGAVRWNNVRPAWQFAKHMLGNKIGQGIDHRVICYHGALLPTVRYEVEKLLDSMLKRKGDPDPVFKHPVIREILDSTEHEEIVVIVSTTSMEEVGRDHDFDWAISEPGSVRSIVQMAGRVQRHRLLAKGFNVGVLKMAFKEHKKRWSGSQRPDIFSYPGVETPPEGETDGRSFMLESHDASVVYDAESWGRSITAAGVISAGEPASELGKLERQKVHGYLMEGLGRPLGALDYGASLQTLMTDYHPRERRFRRQNWNGQMTLVYEPEGRYGEMVFGLVEDKGKYGRKKFRFEPMGSRVDIERLNVEEQSRLLPSIDSVSDAFLKLSARVHGNGVSREERLLSLMGIDVLIPIGENQNSATFVLHPVLGAVSKEK